MFERILNINPILQRKSLFLLGPRQTGKSTFLKKYFPNNLYINLLNTELHQDLLKRPHHIKEIINAYKHQHDSNSGTTIIIDEIQKIPELLDEIHDHIQNNEQDRFILTGSSARKIKKAGINLLGGRAKMQQFFSLIAPERKTKSVSWQEALQWGGIPSILLSSNKRSDLLDYINIYINEEVKAEGLVRNLPSFSKFLDIAATTNTEQIVYESIASDVSVSAVTVKEYYQILEDTLIGHRLYPFSKSIKRKSVVSPKFYFFDTGVANALLRHFELKTDTPEYGHALEHFIYCELQAFISYNEPEGQLFFWRTHTKSEVDFIFQDKNHNLFAIEVKATENVTDKHLKGIRAFAEEKQLPIKHKIVVCLEPMTRQTTDKILITPVKNFLENLWIGKLF